MGFKSASAVAVLCFGALLCAEAAATSAPGSKAAVSGVDFEKGTLAAGKAIAALGREVSEKLARIEKKVGAHFVAADLRMTKVTQRYEKHVMAARLLARPTTRTAGKTNPQLKALKAQHAKIVAELRKKIEGLKENAAAVVAGRKAALKELEEYKARVEHGIEIVGGRVDARWMEVAEADKMLLADAEERIKQAKRLAAGKMRRLIRQKSTMDGHVFETRLAQLKKEGKQELDAAKKNKAAVETAIEANKAQEAEDRRQLASITMKARQQVKDLVKNAKDMWSMRAREVRAQMKEAQKELKAARALAKEQCQELLAQQAKH